MEFVSDRFESITEKGDIGGVQHFLLFQKCFLIFLMQTSSFKYNYIVLSANALNLDKFKSLPSYTNILQT